MLITVNISTKNLIIDISKCILHDLTNKQKYSMMVVYADWFCKNIIYLPRNWSLMNGSFLIDIYDIIQNWVVFVEIMKILQKYWDSFMEILRNLCENYNKFLVKKRKLKLCEILRIFRLRKYCRKSLVKILRYFCGIYENFMWKFCGKYVMLLRKFYRHFEKCLRKFCKFS